MVLKMYDVRFIKRRNITVHNEQKHYAINDNK